MGLRRKWSYGVDFEEESLAWVGPKHRSRGSGVKQVTGVVAGEFIGPDEGLADVFRVLDLIEAARGAGPGDGGEVEFLIDGIAEDLKEIVNIVRVGVRGIFGRIKNAITVLIGGRIGGGKIIEMEHLPVIRDLITIAIRVVHGLHRKTGGAQVNPADIRRPCVAIEGSEGEFDSWRLKVPGLAQPKLIQPMFWDHA